MSLANLTDEAQKWKHSNIELNLFFLAGEGDVHSDLYLFANNHKPPSPLTVLIIHVPLAQCPTGPPYSEFSVKVFPQAVIIMLGEEPLIGSWS